MPYHNFDWHAKDWPWISPREISSDDSYFNFKLLIQNFLTKLMFISFVYKSSKNWKKKFDRKGNIAVTIFSKKIFFTALSNLIRPHPSAW